MTPSDHRLPAGTTVATELPSYSVARFSVEPTVLDILPFNRGFGLLEQRARADAEGWYEADVPGLPAHVLFIFTEAVAQQCHSRVAGRRHDFAPRPGDLVLLPAATDSHWRSRGDRDRILHLHLDPAWLDGLAAEDGLPPPGGDLPLLVGHRDAELTALLGIMRSRMDEMTASRLLAESWAMTAALLLLRLGRPAPNRRLAISPARLARLKAYIEEHLGEGLDVSTLAGVAGLSRFHLARAFRAETGETLHAYVMRRRCDRAKLLLLDGALPLAEIALACGFAHQAHFTTAFGRLVGATPGRWRQERLQ